jgi:hypothetical protein
VIAEGEVEPASGCLSRDLVVPEPWGVPTATHIRRIAAVLAVGTILCVPAAHAAEPPDAAPAPPAGWTAIDAPNLDVTEGALSPYGPNATLRTTSPAMRAETLDGGRHSESARLWFRYLGESTTTVPLGSGLIRRDIGLKLRSANPCNLAYVMWHAFPDNAIQIQVKRNPGQTTSAQCGNRGYTTIATIPLGPGDGTADHGPHELLVQTSRIAGGALAMSVFTNGALLRALTLPANLTAGLEGPIGIRSDNGDYVFGLATAPGTVAAPAPTFAKRTRVSIRLAKKRARAGYVAVTVSNANRFRLAGKLSVAVRGAGKSKAVALHLRANGKTTVKARLPKAARRHRTVSLRLTATVADPAGATRTVRRTAGYRAR